MANVKREQVEKWAEEGKVGLEGMKERGKKGEKGELWNRREGKGRGQGKDWAERKEGKQGA